MVAHNRFGLCFVHGLGGSGKKTWATFLQCLDEDTNVARHDRLIFDYPTMLWRRPFEARALRIQDLARALRTEIGHHLAENREIAIVAHSLGGLIARKYIIDEVKAGRPLRVKRLLAFGEPVSGSALATVGQLLSWRHFHLKQLCRDADMLESINEDWRLLKCGLAVTATYVMGGQDRIVPRETVVNSVYADSIDVLPHEDHRSIIRPKSRGHTSYVILRKLLEPGGTHNGGKNFRSHPALFEVYSPPVEPYYVQRREDGVLAAYLLSKSLWISGGTGLGKTVSILRALCRGEKDYIYVSLAHCSASDPLELLQAIYIQVAEATLPPAEMDANSLATDIIRDLTKLLQWVSQNTSISHILVEEIPLDDAASFAAFIANITALLVYYFGSSGSSVIDFVFSSVLDPRPAIPARSSKIHECVKFMHFARWREAEVRKLIGCIAATFSVELTAEQTTTLVEFAHGSPRSVKEFFREFLALNSAAPTSFSEVLKQMRPEVP